MFTKFVFHKLREIKSFLKIVRARLANDQDARLTGAKEEAQKAAQGLRKVYQQEKQDALRDKQSSSNQDISAI